MKRFIDEYLLTWKNKNSRKPLLLRGARQVGKTHAARQLGKTFSHFVEINFELQGAVKAFYERDLVPERILRELSAFTKQEIIPGKTLLFLDEIQECPQAITSLRYLYEMVPDLHVIAAGSLLDFAIEKIGVPVGRISSLYVYPMSFLEFLYAQGEHRLVEEIQNHDLREEMIAPIHDKLLSLVAEYMCIGGMPEVVQCWVKKKDVKECSRIQNEIIDSYTQDFVKYASKFQIKYVDFLFHRIPLQLGKKFKFSLVDGEYRKRELAPCLHLLNLAGVTRQVFHTSGNGLPLGAEANPDKFKVVFVDVALAQVILGLDLSTWLWDSMQSLVNKGQIVEAFIGQEMLAYSDPEKKAQLYYWHKEARSSQAEVDYLLQKNEHIIPIEVKSGDRGNLKSLRMFLESHQNSPFGIRFSTHNYSKYDNIHSYPLYAVFTLLKEKIFK